MNKTNCFCLKKMFCPLLFLIFSMYLFIGGCSDNVIEGLADDNSQEAKLEEARMAIDDADYSRAISILNGLDQNNAEVLQYQSNAYAGLSGLDTFNLLATIEEINQNNAQGSLDLVGMVLGTRDSNGQPTGIITAQSIDEKIYNFQKAVDSLLKIASNQSRAVDLCSSFSGLSEDQRVQLGLVSLSHCVLTIANVILSDLNISQLKLTEEEVAKLSGIYDLDNSSLTGYNIDGELIDRLVDITNDLMYMGCSAYQMEILLGNDQFNDLSKNWVKFINQFAGIPESDTSDQWKTYIEQLASGNGIDKTDLENFFKNL